MIQCCELFIVLSSNTACPASYLIYNFQKIHNMSHLPMFRSLSSVDELAKATTVLEGSDEYPVDAIILCLWNNILGPHIEHVWMTEGRRHFDYDCIKFVCKHTISSSDEYSSAVHTKFLVLSERAILITSSIFTAEIQSGNTVYALSLVFPHSNLQWYLPLHEFCVIQMDILVTKLRVLLKKNHNDAASKFQVHLCKYLAALKSLKSAQLPAKLDIKDTVFSSGQEKQIDADLLERALISHLQTCGCTIVVGNTVDEVNLNQDCQFSISTFMKEMMICRYPTTLVNLCALEVRQMPQCHEHSRRRHDVLQHEVSNLWDERPNTWFPIL
ncbi:guanine nucleotide exchange C9orf72 homolog isoform X3 [Anneissia japonica]|uniref:guanine nucleotide exchange C9orf72 homolog isoform X3 n=1 Tax=Anneissia japonica TaxID=1529436 RepID=UPI001425831D|nr:guanine nucleotide exchange C9orf72 homolog isoform X3 [Anneissia japonica]